MKEERTVRSPNEIIKFEIEGNKFTYSTFLEKGIFYTFVHSLKNNSDEITINSPLLMQFENNDQNEYYKFKRNFGSLKNAFTLEAKELKTKNKIDHRLVEYFKVNINCDTKWFNPEFSFTENPEYKNGLNNSNSSSNTNRGDVSNYKKCQEIKPVIMLEMLQNLGYITVDKVQHNTQGEDFWSYQLQNGKKFKTSVKTKSFLFENDKNLYSPQNEIFNDVYVPVKGYGKGGIGLIAFLGDNGLFSTPLYGEKNKNERNSRAMEFILNKIYPYVSEKDLANDHGLANALGGTSGVKVINYSRMPFKDNSKINDIKEYLTTSRMLSTELVDKLISQDLLYSGSFSANKIGQDGKHKFYLNQAFFKLTDCSGFETGAEKLSLSDRRNSYTNEIEKKIHKLNTHPVMGNGFRMMSKNPSGTFIAEAVIDVLSAYELFKIAGINPDQFNYISTQGCNNLNGFLNYNAGFGFELNPDYRPFGEVFFVKQISEKEKISQAKIEDYNNAFKNYDFYFINTNNDKCQEILKKVPYANKILGTEIKVLNKSNRNDYIAYNQYQKDKSVFMDETSFDQFFKLNKVTFEYDSEINKYKTLIIKDKIEPLKLSQENKNEIYSKMMKNFGSTTLLFGLDSDEAGLKYRATLNSISDHLGIKVYDMYPQTVQGKENKTDINDLLRQYYKLKDSGKVDEALTIVENFVKSIDPNICLKKNKTITQKP